MNNERRTRLSEAQQIIQDVIEAETEAFDHVPENLQEGIQDNIDELEEADELLTGILER